MKNCYLVGIQKAPAADWVKVDIDTYYTEEIKGTITLKMKVVGILFHLEENAQVEMPYLDLLMGMEKSVVLDKDKINYRNAAYYETRKQEIEIFKKEFEALAKKFISFAVVL